MKAICLPRGNGSCFWALCSSRLTFFLLEASWRSGTLSSARLPLNSSCHSGRSRDEFPRASSLSSFLFGFSVSAGPCCLFLCMYLAVGCNHRRRIFRDRYGFQLGRVKVFPADQLHACSGVHHKLSFLRFDCGCGRQNPLISERKE